MALEIVAECYLHKRMLEVYIQKWELLSISKAFELISWLVDSSVSNLTSLMINVVLG